MALRRLLTLRSLGYPRSVLEVSDSGGRSLYVTTATGSHGAISVLLHPDDAARLHAALGEWLTPDDVQPFGRPGRPGRRSSGRARLERGSTPPAGQEDLPSAAGGSVQN